MMDRDGDDGQGQGKLVTLAVTLMHQRKKMKSSSGVEPRRSKAAMIQVPETWRSGIGKGGIIILPTRLALEASISPILGRRQGKLENVTHGKSTIPVIWQKDWSWSWIRLSRLCQRSIR